MLKGATLRGATLRGFMPVRGKRGSIHAWQGPRHVRSKELTFPSIRARSTGPQCGPPELVLHSSKPPREAASSTSGSRRIGREQSRAACRAGPIISCFGVGRLTSKPHGSSAPSRATPTRCRQSSIWNGMRNRRVVRAGFLVEKRSPRSPRRSVALGHTRRRTPGPHAQQSINAVDGPMQNLATAHVVAECRRHGSTTTSRTKPSRLAAACQSAALRSRVGYGASR